MSLALLSIEGKRMGKEAARRTAKKVTVRQLQADLRRLRRGLEDHDDLCELDAAIERNGGKPGIPWNQVKKELGL